MIFIKSDNELDKMRYAGKIAGEILYLLKDLIKVGITTHSIDQFVSNYIAKHKCLASFKGYQGFPGSICTSVNEKLLHGIPSKDEVLKEGDIVTIDLGVKYQGYNVDCARTYPVGEVSSEATKMIEVAKNAFYEVVNKIKVGDRLGDLGSVVEQYVRSEGYYVPTDYTGHGVGKDLHEDPIVPNYGTVGTGWIIKNKVTLAIEPMILKYSSDTYTAKDGWAVFPLKGGLTTHYENTIVFIDGKIQIITSEVEIG